MSESILSHLEISEIDTFSVNMMDGSWEVYGSAKDQINKWNQRSLILKFSSDIYPQFLVTTFSRSSESFKQKHINIHHSNEVLKGIEIPIIEIILTLDTHRIYDISILLTEIRIRKIDTILT